MTRELEPRLDPLSPLTRQYFERLPGAWAGDLPGEAGDAESPWWVGEAGSVAVGTHVRFLLRCQGGRVAEAAFQAYGCPHTLAVAAWLTEAVVGVAIAAHQSGEPVCGQPDAWLGRFDVPIEKLGRLLIVEDALRNALRAKPLGVVE